MNNSEVLISDEQLMEAVKSGDLQQASGLFDRYHLRIFNFLARLTMDKELAQDLTQNVFLRMIKYRSSYRDGNRFQSWIYQVARNVFSDHHQANKTKSIRVEIEKMSDTTPDPEEQSEQDHREEILRQSMELLTYEERELLVLTRFQHMKYNEVAALMNISVANIKVKVHRAIGKLKEYYFELEKS